MSRDIKAQPISAQAIQGLAELIDVTGPPDKLINRGHCGRFHNRAKLDIAGDTGISLFQSSIFALPFTLDMMERHPHGSQAFLPMNEGSYLVVLAPDASGKPGVPQGFIAGAGQGVNIGRNVWHGVLCPLSGSGLFAVIDRVTDSLNLEEHWFDAPYVVR